MNETMKCILERRSVRGYCDTMPSKEQLEALVSAGLWAPSAMNGQPCHVSVVSDPAIIEQMNGGTKKYMSDDSRARLIERCGSEDFSIFYGAPCVIVISSDNSLPSYNDIDTGIVVQNICIAAQSIGLSSCIIGMISLMFGQPEFEELVKSMNLPNGFRPRVAIAIGVGNKETPPQDRKPNRSAYLR